LLLIAFRLSGLPVVIQFFVQVCIHRSLTCLGIRILHQICIQLTIQRFLAELAFFVEGKVSSTVGRSIIASIRVIVEFIASIRKIIVVVVEAVRFIGLVLEIVVILILILIECAIWTKIVCVGSRYIVIVIYAVISESIVVAIIVVIMVLALVSMEHMVWISR